MAVLFCLYITVARIKQILKRPGRLQPVWHSRRESVWAVSSPMCEPEKEKKEAKEHHCCEMDSSSKLPQLENLLQYKFIAIERRETGQGEGSSIMCQASSDQISPPGVCELKLLDFHYSICQRLRKGRCHAHLMIAIAWPFYLDTVNFSGPRSSNPTLTGVPSGLSLVLAPLALLNALTELLTGHCGSAGL